MLQKNFSNSRLFSDHGSLVIRHCRRYRAVVPVLRRILTSALFAFAMLGVATSGAQAKKTLGIGAPEATNPSRTHRTGSPKWVASPAATPPTKESEVDLVARRGSAPMEAGGEYRGEVTRSIVTLSPPVGYQGAP